MDTTEYYDCGDNYTALYIMSKESRARFIIHTFLCGGNFVSTFLPEQSLDCLRNSLKENGYIDNIIWKITQTDKTIRINCT